MQSRRFLIARVLNYSRPSAHFRPRGNTRCRHQGAKSPHERAGATGTPYKRKIIIIKKKTKKPGNLTSDWPAAKTIKRAISVIAGSPPSFCPPPSTPPPPSLRNASPFTHRQQTKRLSFTSKHNLAVSQSLSEGANSYLITLMHHIIGASAGTGKTNWGTRPGLGIKTMHLSTACLITWQQLTDSVVEERGWGVGGYRG